MTIKQSAGAAPKPPTVPEHVERVLRLAAKFLPGFSAHTKLPSSLDQIANELRGLRPYYVHDTTHDNIEAWLRLYTGES